MQKFLDTLRDLTGKAFACVFALLALWAFYNHSLVGGLLLTGAATLCFPATRMTISERLEFDRRNVRAPVVVTVLACIGILIATVSSVLRDDEQRAAAEIRVAEEKADAERAAQTARNQQFRSYKERILTTVANLMSEGKLSEARLEVSKYTVDDGDFLRTKQLLEAAEIKEKLDGATAMSVPDRIQLLKRLVEIEPANTAAERLRNDLQAAFEKQTAREAAEAARKKQIEGQFSGWDGSHRNVEAAVKTRMHDPDSYKHVETRYRDTGSGLVVIMKFRGTNGFGGVVTSTAIAKVDAAGNVLTLDIN